VIQASSWVAPDGGIQRGAVIVVRDGLIAEVSDKPADAGDLAVETYDDAVVCAGLIDAVSALGATGQLSEPAESMEPKANAADSFDPYHREMAAALRAGVTSFALVPRSDNLVGGQAAVCKTAGEAGPYVLTTDGPMVFSISDRELQPQRNPTSRAGAMAMLRSAIEQSRLRSDSSAMTRFTAGKLPALAYAPDVADVTSLAGIAKEYGVRIHFIQTEDARTSAAVIKSVSGTAIVGPIGMASDWRDARAGGLFEKAEVPVVVAGGLPAESADSLRFGAAVCARSGLSAEAARRAITIEAARALGVADRIGSIEKGKQADLVIFSGDPLDLRSRVIAVYVNGRLAWSAPKDQ
jgi:imidazolonepropionase-like amidohydrolase